VVRLAVNERVGGFNGLLNNFPKGPLEHRHSSRLLTFANHAPFFVQSLLSLSQRRFRS
jgi:hypothetical protein